MTDSTNLPTNQATHEGHDFRTTEAVRPMTIEDAVDEVLRPIVSEHHAAEAADALRKRAAQLLRRESPRNVGPTSQERSYLIDSGAFTPEALSESEQRASAVSCTSARTARSLKRSRPPTARQKWQRGSRPVSTTSFGATAMER